MNVIHRAAATSRATRTSSTRISKTNGAEPINLDKFRTLPSSKASGARRIGRLTNLVQLTIDTSW
jgi:hypothetical protein